jgi:hypothetical protein
MMVGTVLLTCVLLLMAGLALLPIVIAVDTEQAIYLQIDVGGLFKAWGEATAQGWYLGMQLPFFRKKFNLFSTRKTKKKKPRKPASGTKVRSGKSIRQLLRPLSVVSAFRLHYLEWKLDTGDYVRNAQLFPVLSAFCQPSRQVSVNFRGENTLRFKASTRVYRLLVSLLLRNRVHSPFK